MRACQFWGFIDDFVIYCIGYLCGGQTRWYGGHTKLNGGPATSKKVLQPYFIRAAGRCFSPQEKKLVGAIDRCPVLLERRRLFIFFLLVWGVSRTWQVVYGFHKQKEQGDVIYPKKEKFQRIQLKLFSPWHGEPIWSQSSQMDRLHYSEVGVKKDLYSTA